MPLSPPSRQNIRHLRDRFGVRIELAQGPPGAPERVLQARARAPEMVVVRAPRAARQALASAANPMAMPPPPQIISTEDVRDPHCDALDCAMHCADMLM